MQQLLRLRLDLAPALGKRLHDRRFADDLAHRAFRRRFDRAFGMSDIEQIRLRVLDEPEDGKVDIDDVLVAGQHQRLFRHLPARPRRPALARAKADLGAIDAGDARPLHALDRRRPVIIEAGLGHAVVGAEAQHDTDLVGQHPVDAARQPQNNNRRDDDGEAGPHAGAPREGAPEPVLAAPQQFLEIRRLRSARASRTGRPLAVAAAAPAAPRTAAPAMTAAARSGAPRTAGTAALTLPDHRIPFPRLSAGPRLTDPAAARTPVPDLDR